MEEVILRAENVYYSYDENKSYALENLSLEIKRGQKIAVMGANGSGKSTFFLCCNGIYKPTKGKIYFEGSPIGYSRKELLALRERVGIVFQDPDDQLFSASVYQEISFGILNMGVGKDIAKQKVEAVIDELGITPFRDKPAHALSGGQKKQVSIADILVMEPHLIILDEPTAALDPKHTMIVEKMVDELTRQGITVMMALHDVDYALKWADEILLFHEGALLKSGKPIEIFKDKELLRKTNLEQPDILRIFECLQEKNIFGKELPYPKSVEELLHLLT